MKPAWITCAFLWALCPLAAQSPAASQRAAQAALASQQAKEGADCANAKSTADEKVCIGGVQAETENDFKTFFGSLESLLKVDPINLQKLRASQDLWEQYREKSCDAIDTLYREGTIRVAAVQRCRIQLARGRLRDLDVLYHTVLHN